MRPSGGIRMLGLGALLLLSACPEPVRAQMSVTDRCRNETALQSFVFRECERLDTAGREALDNEFFVP